MYDSISIEVPFKNRAKYVRSVSTFVNREVIYSNSGQGYCQGENDGITFSIKSHSANFRGSVATYLFGNNLKTVDMSDHKILTEKLRDEFKLDFSTGYVKRIDTTADLSLNHSVQSYLPLFKYLEGHERAREKNTLYFKSPEHTLRIYDKLNQMKIFDVDQNIMRFEVSHLKASRSIGLNGKLTVGQLFEKETFEVLSRRVLSYFYNVRNSSSRPSINYSGRLTPKIIKDRLARLALESCISIEDILAGVKRSNPFDHASQHTRLKNCLEGLLACDSMTSNIELNEVEEKLKARLQL